MLEAPPREIRSGCPEKMLYAGDLALVSETFEGLKGRLEAWKGALELKGLKVNVRKTKMKVIIEGKFPYAVCRIGLGSNSILYQFLQVLGA